MLVVSDIVPSITAYFVCGAADCGVWYTNKNILTITLAGALPPLTERGEGMGVYCCSVAVNAGIAGAPGA